LQALVQVAAIVDPGYFGQFFFGVGVEILALAVESVTEQDFGG
jgi:hypothetical protein